MARGSSTLSLGLFGTVLVAASACSQTPVAAPSGVAAAPSAHERVERQARVPNEYLVTLAPDASESAIRELFGRFGIQDLNALGGETYLLILKSDPGPGEMEELIRGDSRFAAVQPNLIYWANRSGKSAK